jgi:hypothetical protein
LVPGCRDTSHAATPAKKNSGMIWKIHVRARNTGEVVSRLSQISTLLRMMLAAITVWPTTTPIRAVIRMTSMARSRSAGVRSASPLGLGNAVCVFTH